MGTKSVVMYGLDTPTTTAKYGIERAIAVRQKAVELTAPVVARYDGVAVEDTFFIFDNEWSALAAGIFISPPLFFFFLVCLVWFCFCFIFASVLCALFIIEVCWQVRFHPCEV